MAGPASIADYDAAAAREREFAELLHATRAAAARSCTRRRAAGEMRIEKQREFGRLKFRYEQLRASTGAAMRGYDDWFARALNNARLAAVATYEDCMPGLRRECSRRRARCRRSTRGVAATRER